MINLESSQAQPVREEKIVCEWCVGTGFNNDGGECKHCDGRGSWIERR